MSDTCPNPTRLHTTRTPMSLTSAIAGRRKVVGGSQLLGMRESDEIESLA
jgi:hypothetical protein